MLIYPMLYNINYRFLLLQINFELKWATDRAKTGVDDEYYFRDLILLMVCWLLAWKIRSPILYYPGWWNRSWWRSSTHDLTSWELLRHDLLRNKHSFPRHGCAVSCIARWARSRLLIFSSNCGKPKSIQMTTTGNCPQKCHLRSVK